MKVNLMEGIGNHEAVRIINEKMNAGDYITFPEFDKAWDSIIENNKHILGAVKTRLDSLEANYDDNVNYDAIDKIIDTVDSNSKAIEQMLNYYRCWKYEINNCGNIPFQG